jgi:protein-S-isoprenylcysteine O-methyltransferase Ste14
MITYETVILTCWATFIVVWAVSALNTKQDVPGSQGKLWQQFGLLRLVAAVVVLSFVAVRIATGTAHFTNFGLIFSRGIFPESTVLGWTAAALSVIGLGFAIWARVQLGRNWSPRPAAKEEHELVTTGPYAYVRHPIYTGVILMAFGAAVTGSFWGIGVFIIACLTFILRIGKEEQIILELFPNEYPEYQKRTKRLVPFVW